MKCLFTKIQGGLLVPADDNAQKLVESIKLGACLSVEATRTRNYRFHKKFFSLLNLAFDVWSPEGKEHKGEPIQKNFDRFREDILIMAGHYDAVFSIDGYVRFTAKSISFARMDEDEFSKVYQAVLNVVWEKILRQANYKSPEEVEEIVNKLLAYGG